MSVQTREDQVREWIQRAMDANDREVVARYHARRAESEAAIKAIGTAWWERMPVYDQLADETGFLRQVEINAGMRIKPW